MTSSERAMIQTAARAEGYAEGFDAGFAAGEVASLPFRGIGRVAFRRDLRPFEATVRYEADLRYEIQGEQLTWRHAELRVAQAENSHRRAARVKAERDQPHDLEGLGLSARLALAWRGYWERRAAARAVDDGLMQFSGAVSERDRIAKFDLALRAELAEVRKWLDRDCDNDARSQYARDRHGLRRDNVFRVSVERISAARFFGADEARRGFEDWRDRDRFTPGGVPFGHDWTWELPERPWDVTRWSIFWLESGEIYARHRPPHLDDRFAAEDHGVIVLGSVLPWPDWVDTTNFLAQLERTVMCDGHNTVVAVAEAVAEEMAAARQSM